MNAGRAASGNWRGLTGERTGGAAACLVGVAILALAVWGGVTRAEGGTACPDPIKIALTTSMTTDMALLGVQARNGLQLAVDELNAGKGIAGKKIHLTVEDNAASSTTALNALNRVVGGNPLVVYSSMISPHLFTQSDVIKREELPFIIAGTNAGLTAQGIPWLFRIHVHDGQLADLTPRYVVEQLKKTKPAIIAVADDFGLGASKGIQATLAELKVKPVAVESYAPTDKDMSAQLLNIKNKGADIVMIWGRPADVTIVLKQMKQLGITTPKIGNASIVAKTTLDNLSDEEADGAMAIGGLIPQASAEAKLKNFTRRIEEKFKVPPDNFAPAYYDSLFLLKEIIEAVGCDRAAIKDRLAQTKGWQGLMIKYTADKNRDLAHTVGVYQNKGKTPVLLGTLNERGF
jgi:branched-chain amino acid transport system substrate-binding protein